MDISKKVAYIKGLADGLELDKESKEGKIIAAMLDVLDEMADTITEMAEIVAAVTMMTIAATMTSVAAVVTMMASLRLNARAAVRKL